MVQTRVLKESKGGTLTGAYAPPLENVSFPKLDLKPSKVYNVKAPGTTKCLPGSQIRRKIEGETVVLTIPEGFDRLKAGRFKYTHLGDVDKVISTTLPTVPGHEIALAKPIVYGCETLIFDDRGFSGKPTLAKVISQLTQEAQNQVNSLAIEHQCNAVLGMQFSVTTTCPATGKCQVAVNCFGTPCVIVPAANLPATKEAPNNKPNTLYAEGTNTDDRTVHSLMTEATGSVIAVPTDINASQRTISLLGQSPGLGVKSTENGKDNDDDDDDEDDLLPPIDDGAQSDAEEKQ